MQDVIAALISWFLIQPLEAGVREKLEAARAPRALVSEIVSCIEKETGAIANRAWSDPWWVVSTTVRVWTGAAAIDQVAAEAAPACAPAIRSGMRFLDGANT